MKKTMSKNCPNCGSDLVVDSMLSKYAKSCLACQDTWELDFKPNCESCKAACRIEGWGGCWDLCACKCHIKKL